MHAFENNSVMPFGEDEYSYSRVNIVKGHEFGVNPMDGQLGFIFDTVENNDSLYDLSFSLSLPPGTLAKKEPVVKEGKKRGRKKKQVSETPVKCSSKKHCIKTHQPKKQKERLKMAHKAQIDDYSLYEKLDDSYYKAFLRAIAKNDTIFSIDDWRRGAAIYFDEADEILECEFVGMTTTGNMRFQYITDDFHTLYTKCLNLSDGLTEFLLYDEWLLSDYESGKNKNEMLAKKYRKLVERDKKMLSEYFPEKLHPTTDNTRGTAFDYLNFYGNGLNCSIKY